MKLKVFLAISLCLNALLGVWLWRAQSGAGERATAPVYTNHQPMVVEKVMTNLVTPRPLKSVRTLDWRAVESDDYKEYIANLREVGCPEETIRDIIIADVNKLYKTRAQQGASTNKFEYWKPGNPFAGILDADKIEAQQQLSEEKRALLKQLLGEEVTLPLDLLGGFNPFDDLLGFLPEATRNELLENEQRFGAKLAATLKDAAAGDMTAMKAVQAEKDAELLRLLGPEQKLEYELRLSQTAMVLRMQLNDFEPTEQEFREMFQLRKEFDDEFGLMGASDPRQAEARATARKQLDESMKSVLGEERYQEYRYDQDWRESSLRHVATEHNIPKEKALGVFDLKYAAEEEAARVRNNPALNAEQRQQTLDAIRQETESSVAQVLGPNAAQAYVERGSWIKGLNR